jgi:hypothetical protein
LENSVRHCPEAEIAKKIKPKASLEKCISQFRFKPTAII